MSEQLISWARTVARNELAEPLPRRWAHTQGVADRASRLEGVLGRQAGLLTCAALLHDVGYAPTLAATGFHPLDGARFLRDVHGADDQLTRLVANHSFALLEADERGLREVLEAEFPLLEDQFLVDALVWCDMTTTPDGSPTTTEARVAEILGRYGVESLVGRFIRRASPEIFAAVARVEAVLAGQPRWG
ncbi:metal-dependent phosphohydrolase, HD subdomain protein [Kitasatospora xanthocidica]|uniref:HD domain-containing protein n=1 Tax=Kitasatospora xanthocidica TaxID=83382 RepID=UPI00167840B1|nr:HD domain-containing protein [Kitasatospora xanthocidica]GHF31227.1 metal-dependent phosphohydrolase, HD subdomain protein [Kitasatospora xanthocidica]